MVPEAAVQDTVEAKLPVPETVAEHWLVWPVCKLVGAQATATEVIAGVCIRFVIVPPPQPANGNAPKKKRLKTAFRAILFLPFHNPERHTGADRLNPVLSCDPLGIRLCQGFLLYLK